MNTTPLKPTIINGAWVSLPAPIVERASALRHLAATQERLARGSALRGDLFEHDRLIREAAWNRDWANRSLNEAMRSVENV